MHRNEHFRRIAYFSESLAGHLEDCQLRSRSETVLYTAEKPVCAPVVSLELKHDIHYMLQNLRTRDASFLSYMANQNHRNASLLGKPKEHGGCFLYLSNRTWRRLHILRKHCLNRIDNHQVRHHLASLSKNILHQGLAIDHAPGVITTDACSAKLYLFCTFLTGHIKRLESRAMKRNLQ